MTDEQFKSIQKSLLDIRNVILAGFSTLAGLHLAKDSETESGKALGTAEYFDAIHDGLDVVLSMLNNTFEEADDLLGQDAPARKP